MNLIFFKFIYLGGGTSGAGAEKEGERESQAGFILSAQSPMLEPTNCEMMTWAQGKSQTFNQPSHTGAPKMWT